MESKKIIQMNLTQKTETDSQTQKTNTVTKGEILGEG